MAPDDATADGDATAPSGATATHDSRTADVPDGAWPGAPIGLGASMGRYELRQLVGAGGMGVVFEARDPELDRTVAVKVLRSGGMPGSEGERRLRREGQTMARLTHPNVLRVYDVGVDHGHVFVAMEFVAGGTLADWLARAPRTPEEILAMLVQAGQGLAAAHDAGLVHRDFKPSNVMVGADGRALVTDFGLARAAAADAEEPAQAAQDPGTGIAMSPLVTLTGADQRVGTPAYMAPEQHAAAQVDARADQFSFCVAAWRALFGTPPFAGGTAAELAAATTRGELSPPPPAAAGRVSPRIRAALERGLRPRPEDRFPSMAALLAELAPPPARNRWWLVAVPVGVAAAALAIVWSRPDPAPAVDVCAAQVDRAAEVWNPGTAAGLRHAFAASGATYADAAFGEVSRQLAARAADWEAMRRDSCEATRIRREQSDAMMDVRAACLDQRLADLRGFVDELRRADEPAVRAAVRAAATIGDVTACGDVAALSRRAPKPPAKVQREAIAAVEAELSALRAKSEAGRHREVAGQINDVIARARATSYSPVVAEALFLAARAEGQLDQPARAETLLEEAVLAAEAGGDDVLRFDCETALVRVVGFMLERDADGARHADRAAALLTRLGPDLRRAARLADARAALDWWHGRYAAAHAKAEEAVALQTKIDPQGAELAAALHTRAMIEDELGRNAETVATEERALAIAEKAFGARHPSVGNMWNTRGGALRRLGRYDEARASLRRGMEILEEVYGPKHQTIASSLLNLATVDLDEKKYDDAIVLLRRGLAIYESAIGADHSRTALAVERLGSALSKGGHHAEAEVMLRRAIDINAKRIGPDSPQVAQSYKQLGEHFLRAGDAARSRPAYVESVRAYEVSQGKGTPMAARSLLGLGDAELALGKRAAAVAAYERALAAMAPDAESLRREATEKLAKLRGGR